MDCVKDLYVVGSSDDTGLCIGGIFAYLDKEGRGNEIEKIESLYLGDDITSVEIDEIISIIEKNEKYYVVKNPSYKMVAEKIAEGYILGRAIGKMEFGARALGNRSILADPRNIENIDKINKKVKNRDFWMPFTPSILDTEQTRYLINEKNYSFPFMALACDTTEEGKKKLPAAIHPSDKTARPQIVTSEMNNSYYQLLSAFKELTGVGALLNTSLNIHGYPIARTVKDAFWVLDNSGLDGLILENCMILRRERE